MRIRLLLVLILALCLLPLGCKTTEDATLKGDSLSLGDSFDQATLTAGTTRLLAECYANMVTISAEAARRTEQYSVRESSIRWRILTAGRLDRIRAISDPRLSFAALWTQAAQMRISFTEGEDAQRFGDQQKLYAEFAREFETSVVQVAYEAFPDAVVEQVRPEIDNLARTVGVTGWFAARGAPTAGRNALSQLISVPLSPISGLQGVGNTPEAINRFTEAAHDMTRVVDNLPERTRWQVELMLLEAETSGATAAALKEIAITRKAIERVSTGFPEQAKQLLADPNLAETFAGIQGSLKLAGEVTQQFGKTLVEFRQSLAEVRETLVQSQHAAAAVQKASAEVRLTTEAIRGPEKMPTTQPADDKDEFRVADVEAAAARIQAAAAEIREVIADLRAEGSMPAIDIGTERASGLVTRLTWSIAILIGLVFVAALTLMVIWRMLGRKATT